MTFLQEVKQYFKFLTDAGFRKRAYFISGSMCDEAYVYKRKNIKIEIEFNSCANPYDIYNFDSDQNWYINIYMDIGDTHENLAYCELFPSGELETLREQILSYEYKNVNRQLEIYANFIKSNFNLILDKAGN